MRSARQFAIQRRVRNDAELGAFQRLMFQAVIQPLGGGNGLRPLGRTDRRLAEVAAKFVKPSARLAPVERLQIYVQCYWNRVTNCVHNDCPALRTLLGKRKFDVLARAYLARYPSRSFTLRNLCSRLANFILEQPRLTAPHTELAHAIARFEWAQATAFDGATRPALTIDRLGALLGIRGRVALQPHISLLALDWPADEFVVAVRNGEMHRSEASNVVDGRLRAMPRKRVVLPRRRRVRLVVHRHEMRTFCKRVSLPAFAMLEALASGRSLADAALVAQPELGSRRLHAQLAEWMALGWFCERSKES